MNESSSSPSSSSSFLVEHQSSDAADSASSPTTTTTTTAAATTTAMITGEPPPSPPGEPAIRSPPPITTAIDSSSSYSPSSSSSMTSKIKIAETATATLATAKKLHQKQPSGKHVTDLLLLPDDGDDDEHDHNDDGKNGIGTSNNNNNNNNNNGRIIPNGVSWNSADSQQNSNENNNNNHGNSNHDNISSSSNNNGSNNTITDIDDNFIISKNTNNRNHSPSRITYATTAITTTTESTNTSTQGRRSITLRLHERIDSITTPPNPNSSHSTNNAASFVSISSSPLILSSVRSLRRFRSMSLSGLPFANVVNAAVQAEEAADGKSFGTTATATDNAAAAAAAANHGDENNKEHHPLLSSSNNNININSNPNGENKIIVDRGIITVSWYEGTTTTDMSDHVYNCVLRRLNSERSRRRRQQNKTGAVGERDKDEGKLKLEDVRLIDETVTPHGEVVLCPFLPDGSSFVLQFKTSIDKPPPPPSTITPSNAMINGSISTSSNSLRALPSLPPWYASRAPESPSAEPRSPYLINNGHQSYSDYLIQHQSHRAVQHQQIQTQQLLSAVAALLQKQHQQQQQQHSVSGGGGNVVVSSHHMNSNGIGPTMVPNITSVAEEEEEEESAPPTKEWKSPPTATTSQEDGDGDDDDDDDEVGQEEEDSMSFNSPIKLSSKALLATTLGSSSTISAMNTHAENSTTLNVTSSGATETAALTTDQLIEQQLRQLNELFLLRKLTSGLGEEGNIAVDVGGDGKSGSAVATMDDDDQAHLVRAYYRAEKKQVIFVIANYFVLFLSLIALSAEIQSRLPQWMDWVQQNYDSVQNCATDQGALIECLSNGDFSGLVASFLLWATQSASAKRIFLFGFDTPKKLWTVVYEALVTAVCWGMSYLFIRRGLNPNTRQNFIQIYWKDAVYGSLAGFNAAFMKAVLKNLIPQEVALEALEGRQLRIRHWLLSLMED